MIWILISLSLVLICGIIDYFVIRKWARESISRMNDIFDSIKSFVYLHIIDRLNGAIHYEDDVDDYDESENLN